MTDNTDTDTDTDASEDSEEEPGLLEELGESATTVGERAREWSETARDRAGPVARRGLERGRRAAVAARDGAGDAEPRVWMDEHRGVVAGVAIVVGLLAAVAVLLVAPPLWRYGLLAFGLGVLPALAFFPWITSPFSPGLWVLSAPFARIHLTLSQVIRKAGVLVKRSSNNYELATYDADSEEAVVSDGRVPIDESSTRWGLFGKRKLGLTWELGTDIHERIRAGEPEDAPAVSNGATPRETAADGRGSVPVSLNAAHRLFRGVNEAETITRTKEQAEAEHGGGEDGLDGLMMAGLVMMMLLLGSATTYFML